MALQFKVQIKGITKPPVWRKISVPDKFTFFQLHIAIQASFGWENAHMFQFKENEYRNNTVIGIPYDDDFYDDDFASRIQDASKVKISTAFQEVGQKLLYEYDFGDGWIHELTLEAIDDKKDKNVVCLSGKGACPPEDCGGDWGYEDMKEIFKMSPDSEQAQNLRDWLGLEEGENWDSAVFDINEVNALLKKIRWG